MRYKNKDQMNEKKEKIQRGKYKKELIVKRKREDK